MSHLPIEKVKQIKEDIDRALSDGATPIAAFDADGTLWNMDMGENFFDYQIRKKLLPDLPPDPWAFYKKIHDEDEPRAFMWLAQINKGVEEEQLRDWAKAALAELGEIPVFHGVREIIQYLQRLRVDVYVVTASIRWAVEPGAEWLGIPRENVIGVKTKVSSGRLTSEPDGVVTWHEGKVAGLLEATKQKKPFLAAGNTMGDLALLDLATHIRLANCGAQPGHRIYETEQKLIETAAARGWHFHRY